MRRVAWLWAALGVALVFASPAAARTQTYFGFQIGITNAPPPHVVFYEEPDLCEVPGYDVYVVEDCPYDYDVFRYGRSWYVCDDGYWYRGYGYGGPYRAIDVRYIPRTVLYASVSYRDYPRYRSHRGYYRSRDWDDRDRSWGSRDGGRRYYRDRGDWAYRNRDWRDRDRRDYRDWDDRRGDYRSRDSRIADSRDWGDRRGDWRSRDRGDDRGRGHGKGKHKGGDRDDD